MPPQKTTIKIPKMDCPSEERIIRMALERVDGIFQLSFDLNSRQLVVTHNGKPDEIVMALQPLNFGAVLIETTQLSDGEFSAGLNASSKDADESRVLKQLLAINAVMFVLEVVLGWIAQSAGLIADSLDMFADAGVYGLSLYAVGRAAMLQRRAARVSGYLQLVLALGALAEVFRRAIFGSEPESLLMMGVAGLALVANIGCMLLLAKHRQGAVHMKASWIFSTNDVLANIGVICAGLLVWITASKVPDLVIGVIIACVVFSGAIRILRVSK